MTEYTPTTLDVLEAYKGQIIATDKPNTYEIIDEGQAISEFGRWLNNERQRVAAHAVRKEHDRLIALMHKFQDSEGYVNMKVTDVEILLRGDDNA